MSQNFNEKPKEHPLPIRGVDMRDGKEFLLGDDEQSVIDHLAAAWNVFLSLSPLHPDDLDEFRRAIHAAQHIIMSRPVAREIGPTPENNR